MGFTLTAKEERVLQALYKLGIPSTSNNIADKAGMSWNTVVKILKKLHKDGFVEKKKIRERVFWNLR
jgi:DNA-binding MarR family transcriptional regulator